MPRKNKHAPYPKRFWNRVRQYYETHKTSQLKVAHKFGVSVTTLRKHVKEDNWSKPSDMIEINDKEPKQRIDELQEKAGSPKQYDESDFKFLDKFGLTPQQKQYVQYRLVLDSPVSAYQRLGRDVKDQRFGAYAMEHNSKVQKAIQATRDKNMLTNGVSINDLIQQLQKIAGADIGQYADWGNTEVLEKDEKGNVKADAMGNPMTYNISWLYFNDRSKLDTSVIKSISIGRNGPTVELYDKQWAIEQLLKIYGIESNERLRKLKADADIAEETAKNLKSEDHGKQTIKFFNEWGAEKNESSQNNSQRPPKRKHKDN